MIYRRRSQLIYRHRTFWNAKGQGHHKEKVQVKALLEVEGALTVVYKDIIVHSVKNRETYHHRDLIQG
jgi:hypothetical protein